MSSKREELTSAMKEALKNKDQLRLDTVRLIIAQLKMKDIEARGLGKEAADEAAILSMMQTMIKQRQESAKMYRDGNRPELAEKEEAEIKQIESFLPQQMSATETEAAIKKIIADTGASSVKDMGKVMAEVKAKYAGQMDMAQASSVIKGLLAA
ncbi:MAG: GatB/YqeY domain-containing protein [Alphaproteobacteria bacterium]|nr:GatB/YqeY domain-containing protein [Alphaproteobacteria bacterium]